MTHFAVQEKGEQTMRPIDADAAVDRYYAEWDKKDICDGAQDRDWLKQCIDEAPISSTPKTCDRMGGGLKYLTPM